MGKQEEADWGWKHKPHRRKSKEAMDKTGNSK